MILHKMTGFPIRDIFETIGVNEIKTTGKTSNIKVVSSRESLEDAFLYTVAQCM